VPRHLFVSAFDHSGFECWKGGLGINPPWAATCLGSICWTSIWLAGGRNREHGASQSKGSRVATPTAGNVVGCGGSPEVCAFPIDTKVRGMGYKSGGGENEFGGQAKSRPPIEREAVMKPGNRGLRPFHSPMISPNPNLVTTLPANEDSRCNYYACRSGYRKLLRYCCLSYFVLRPRRPDG
jgi:hypothetical protein